MIGMPRNAPRQYRRRFQTRRRETVLFGNRKFSDASDDILKEYGLFDC
jgi:hypothetical protein